ncbi:MAG: indole-3-glycerol phosphate synthase TrpC [Spirochaetaceae bacterium]|nr:MAG: indole-3-glycerol phosphate synthase TrpC [Spirochaetaceae bacterium]
MPEAIFGTRQPELPSILKTILADKAARLEADRRRTDKVELARLCRNLPPPLDFRGALHPAINTSKRNGGAAGTGGKTSPSTDSSNAIIAEFKRRSPSRGLIRSDFDLAEIHNAYTRGGAAAYSVLTEEDNFDGSLDDLKVLRQLAQVPLLRKDFLFDSYQIYESRASGADALLLIVAALQEQRLTELIELSRELAMEALVEVHSAEELDRALTCGARIVGINNRDLHSFQVDLDVSLRLARSIPENITVVSESGIRGPEDIRRLRAVGIRAFLVGEHLMSAEDPAAALRRLKEAL